MHFEYFSFSSFLKSSCLLKMHIQLTAYGMNVLSVRCVVGLCSLNSLNNYTVSQKTTLMLQAATKLITAYYDE